MSRKLLAAFACALLAGGVLAGCQTSEPLSPLSGDASPTDAALGNEAVGIRPGTGAVFTMTNAIAANEVLVYRRDSDGQLTGGAPVATGGQGTGAGLGNQGGLALSANQRWLLAVNAGSNDVSLFRWNGHGLMLTDVEPSGGMTPISVTIHGDLVYVLNAASPASLHGFRVSAAGELIPIAGSERPLSGADVGPAQVQFSPAGDVLVVTEKATSSIVTYTVAADGSLSMPNVHPSSGQTPFGFAFTRHGQILVSEAFGGATDASALSSYAVTGSMLTPIDPTVPTTETAACWVAVTPNGRFAYTTNTGSSSLTGFRVMENGELEILDADGRTGETTPGSRPIDLVVSRMGHYVYALLAGTNEIAAFGVGADGSLSSMKGVAGLPAGTNGLAGF